MTVNIKDRDSYVFEYTKTSMRKGLIDKVPNAYPDENIPAPEVIELQKVVKKYEVPAG